MKRFPNSLSAITASLLLTLTTPGLQAQPASGPQPGHQQIQVSEAKLTSVATAYLDVMEVQTEFKPKIQAAKSMEVAKGLQQEANQKMIQAIDDQKGVEVNEYHQIVSSTQTDVQLRQRMMAKIQELQEERAKERAKEEAEQQQRGVFGG